MAGGDLLTGDEAVGDAIRCDVAHEDAYTASESCPEGGYPITAYELLCEECQWNGDVEFAEDDEIGPVGQHSAAVIGSPVDTVRPFFIVGDVDPVQDSDHRQSPAV